MSQIPTLKTQQRPRRHLAPSNLNLTFLFRAITITHITLSPFSRNYAKNLSLFINRLMTFVTEDSQIVSLCFFLEH